MSRALVNFNFQLDVGSYDMRFQFQVGISNGIIEYPMNLQNLSLEIQSASLMMSGTQKFHLGLTLKHWSNWNLKYLTEFLFGYSNFHFKFQNNN